VSKILEFGDRRECTMNENIQRNLVQDVLRIMAEHVSAAQVLLEQDGERCIDALKFLAEAFRAGSQGIVALMGTCLEETLDIVQAGSGDLASEEIDQLIKLADYSLLNLCFPCREEVGRSLTRTRSDATSSTKSKVDNDGYIEIVPNSAIGKMYGTVGHEAADELIEDLRKEKANLVAKVLALQLRNAAGDEISSGAGWDMPSPTQE
jgi:hypothetical protein